MDKPEANSYQNLIGKLLLIVEDDWLLQNLLSTKLLPLRDRGTTVISAFDGAQAIELAKKERPDVILLDILLPGMTGLEFLEHMQQEDPTFKQVPVIIFSNLNDEENRERAEELGVREFMHKADSTMEEIIEKVESILGE